MDNLSTTHDRVADLKTEVGNFEAQFDLDRPHQRIVASDALASIDAALRLLHGLRGELTQQMSRYDYASLVRTDDLLRQVRAERDDTPVIGDAYAVGYHDGQQAGER